MSVKKKWHPMRSACSLEVKQLKTGVFQLKDLTDKKHLKIERCVSIF